MKLLVGLILVFCLCSPVFAYETYQDLDDFAVTGETSIPSGGDGWTYSSWKTNTGHSFNGSCGWFDGTKYASPNGTLYNYFYLYKNTYNSDHMGYTSFSYLEIDDDISVKGNSLKIVTTGGMKDDGNTTVGLALQTKEEYLTYLNDSQGPVGDEDAGSPYIYFSNGSVEGSKVPFPEAYNANSLSMYFKLPSGVDLHEGTTSDVKVGSPSYFGPANTTPSDSVLPDSGHWYNDVHVRGGGWAHILMDSHPNHFNAWSDASDWPYPSSSVRDMGTHFFDRLSSLYWATTPYGEFSMPKYNIWVDEIEFKYDSEQQNGETINNLALLYVPTGQSIEGQQAPYFEIGFSSKYKNTSHDRGTYQARYSFSPITNDNWSSAKPIHVKVDSFFGTVASDVGVFKKPNAYRDGVWCMFTIDSTDEPLLTAGTTIYFAVKDVSQDPTDLQQPNPLYNYGRSYVTYASDLDYAGDATALPYIKRIDFYISGKKLETNNILPAQNLEVTNQ